MRITTILLFITTFHAFALKSYSQTAKFSINEEQMTLTDLFSKIEAQSEFLFFYVDADVKNVNVKVNAQNKPIEEVLSQALKGTSLAYTINNRNINVFSKNAGIQQSKKRITGTVVDAEGNSVIGASIQEKGTSTGTITDAEGNFIIEVAPSATLRISYLGYLTEEINIGNNSVVSITLSEDARALDEVVVVGYGTQARREITGSVAHVTPKDFNQGLSTNAADLLKGKVAGLVINSGSGDVTAGSTIRLRGISTLQNDEGPFVVIDGIPGADMSTVSPQDIESITILKDASSAAIYGSRSAGGVILITTKRGTASKPMLNYTGAVGISTIANKPNLLTADEWRQYNINKDAATPGTDGDGAWKVLDRGADTDWFDEITRQGFQQDHAVSLSGGSAYNSYRGSVSYMQREGLTYDNYLERYNMRLQLSQYALNNRLKIDLTGVMTLTDNSPAYERNFLLAYNMLPVVPVKNADGTWFDTQEYDQGNPVRNQTDNSREHQINNSYGTISATWNIIDGLDTKLMLAKSRNSDDYSLYNSKGSEAGIGDNGFAQRSGEIRNMDLLEWTSNYNKQLGEHKIEGMIGYSWQQDQYSYHYAQNRGFITDLLGSNDLESGSGLRKGDVSSEKNESQLISFFARANYNYMGKYVLTASFRRDGSSKFGANNKWGNFPSLAVAWNINQENFMKDVSWINSLRFRAGYGSMGNQSGLDPYKTLALYGLYDERYYDNGAWKQGYGYSQNENPNLRWETTSMFNVGVDFDLFDGRFGGTVEWYDKETTDMLYDYTVPIPPNQYGKMMSNVGSMSNKGIEVTLNAIPVHTHNFSWNVALEVSHNKNKVTKLSNDLYQMNSQLLGNIFWRGGRASTHILEEGRPVGQFYGLVSTGLDEKGKYIFVDQNNDGSIDEPGDCTYIGDANPVLNYGLTNSFKYKNIDFSFFFRGSLGNDLLSIPRVQYAQADLLPGANALDDPLTYTLKETPRYSSMYIEDGSYLRLDNMSLGYSFKWLNGGRIYATAQNLFVITNYKGMDPELPIDQTGGLAPGVEAREFYPKSRTFSLGLSINF